MQESGDERFKRIVATGIANSGGIADLATTVPKICPSKAVLFSLKFPRVQSLSIEFR